jgi:1,4-dihydroxy-2-naphthoate octaprenyltransferase
MRKAFLITFVLAGACGVYLVARGGWPIVAIGGLALAFGVLYTGGPRPLGYLGLGDLLVFVFFGPVAVAGTYYVQALEWSAAAAVAGLGPGLLSTALLSVNNLRDIAGDGAAGKRTLAVRFGPIFTKAEFTLCVAGAALVPVLMVATLDGPPGALAATLACLFALPALRAVLRWQPGDALQVALAGVGRVLILYALAFSLGWWLWR